MSIKDMATAYAKIIKAEKQADGTLMVYGKATDDSLDIDQQICDATWLDRAMPDWFKSGGNIREQHSNIAAGVAKEYEVKSDGHYINALVVDPVSVKKVETGVLKGFSIGIKSPRVVRDNKAVNGRIIDGQIVEVSLVDRPANPNAKLMLAKSVDGEENLVKVEEMIEQEETSAMKEEGDGIPVNGEAKSIPSREEMIERYASARKALDDITRECKECGYEDIMKQYGETAEEETAEGPAVSAETALEEVEEARSGEMISEKSTTEKCLDCGCHMPSASHGLTQVPVAGGTPGNEMANVSTAVMVSPDETPKSAQVSETEKESEKSPLSDAIVSDIIEKAVKSATDSVKTEIELIKSAKEAVENELDAVKQELATAKSLAMSGGPKRTAIQKNADADATENARLANEYLQKASNTTDKDLAKGYRELAKKFSAKSVTASEVK